MVSVGCSAPGARAPDDIAAVFADELPPFPRPLEERLRPEHAMLAQSILRLGEGPPLVDHFAPPFATHSLYISAITISGRNCRIAFRCALFSAFCVANGSGF